MTLYEYMCREFYEHLRDWIIETELDRYRSGRVFEYMWAVMFGAPPVSEPIEECDLLVCTDEVCAFTTQIQALPQQQPDADIMAPTSQQHAIAEILPSC